MSDTYGGGRYGVLPRSLLMAPLASLAAALALVMAACGTGPPGQDEDAASERRLEEPAVAGGAESRARPATPIAEADMPQAESDSLRLELVAPDRVRTGEPVPITVRAENIAGRALTLYLVGRDIAFDVIVEDADGAVVWRRLEGEVIQQVLRLEELPAGRALTLETTWEQRSNAGDPVPPGSYTVRGELLTEGEPLRTPAAPLTIR